MRDRPGFTRRMPIRFADVDYARVLYFPRQLHFLHTVMEDFFREAVGIPYSEMLGKDKLGLPTVRLEIDFTAPLRFGDEVEISIHVQELGRSRVVFRYEVRRADSGELAASALQTTVAIDCENWKTVALPARYRQRLEAMMA